MYALLEYNNIILMYAFYRSMLLDLIWLGPMDPTGLVGSRDWLREMVSHIPWIKIDTLL